MLLASTQIHLATAPESTMNLGRLISITAVAHIAKAAIPTNPLRQTISPTSASKHTSEARDSEEPQPSFWQGEPVQPKPATSAAPAEELAIWEACEYLRSFVRDNWGEGAEHAAVIECEMPIARIREFGRLPERQGTRSCTRLIRIPVLAEEIGHRLWRLLSEEVTREALATEEQDCEAAAVLVQCHDRSFDPGHDSEGGSVTVERALYKQCWICHGQSKYQEVEESAGTMTSCYRCMECFHRFDVEMTRTTVVDSKTCDAGEKGALSGSFGRVFGLRRKVTKSMPELRRHIEFAKSCETRTSFEVACSPATSQFAITTSNHTTVSAVDWREPNNNSSWSECMMDVWRRRDPKNIKHGLRPVAEPISFQFSWT
ncbi:hypothetical protein MCOR25_002972 [Pyricularia grisea]|nr:hypothetical protein MCOR25_002972 [Pyricularia grisea]